MRARPSKPPMAGAHEGRRGCRASAATREAALDREIARRRCRRARRSVTGRRARGARSARRQARPAARRPAQTISIAARPAGHRDAYAVRLHLQRRPLVGDLQRRRAGRVADQQRWRRAGSRASSAPDTGTPQALVARPARGPAASSSARGDDLQRAVMRGLAAARCELARSRLLRQSASYSPARSARSVTLSPGASTAGGVRRRSHSGTGVRPRMCQPPGLSSV